MPTLTPRNCSSNPGRSESSPAFNASGACTGSSMGRPYQCPATEGVHLPTGFLGFPAPSQNSIRAQECQRHFANYLWESIWEGFSGNGGAAGSRFEALSKSFVCENENRRQRNE